MKHLYFVLILILATCCPSIAQQQSHCYSAETPPENGSVGGCNSIDFFSSYEDLPPIGIRVNIHWYAKPDGSNLTPIEGTQLAETLLGIANDQLANLPQNMELGNTGLPIAHVPNAKWHFELYSNPAENPDDIHGGVFYHPYQEIDGIDFTPTFKPYDDKTLNLHFIQDPTYDLNGDGTPSSAAGYALPYGHSVVMFNVTYFAGEPNMTNLNGKVLNHEVGHCLGLAHAQDCSNPCANIPGDLFPIRECDVEEIECQVGPTFSCDWDNGNNLMMSGNNCLALTPCQWTIAYNTLFRNKPYAIKEDLCAKIPIPISIENNQLEIWDEIKFVQSDVRVKSGGQLIIRCLSLFAPGVGIYVERGGRLIVDGGILSNLCLGEKWRGIDVWGNSIWAQPDPLLGILPPDRAGVAIFTNSAKVEMAEYGVYAGFRPLSNDPIQPQPSLNGGLVIVEDGSIFLKNNYGVYLPSYKPRLGTPLANRCVFNDAIFRENSVGITIGGTDGINISGCKISGFGGKGLTMWDSEVMVSNGSIFSNMLYGIEAFATHPYSTQLIVDGSGKSNTIQTNQVGIFIKSVDKGVGLLCKSNTIDANYTGIAIEGPSNYVIRGNLFNLNQIASIDIRHTSSIDSRAIACNRFEWGKCFEIYARGKNDKLIFDRNTFTQWTFENLINFYLTGDDAHPGSIGPAFLGLEENNPLYNCFGVTPANLVTAGNTEFFNYVSPSEANDCYTPRCDLDDAGCTNNFFFLNTPIPGIQASCSSNSPENSYTPLDEGNIGAQPPYRKLGYYIGKQDYPTANQLLNTLPLQTTGQIAYKMVQEINIARLTVDGFQLSNEQASLLENIRDQNNPEVSPYADGLLKTLNREAPDWQPATCVIVPPQAAQRDEDGIEAQKGRIAMLHPIPADAYLAVTLDVEAEYHLILTDLQGRVCLSQNGNGQNARLQTDLLPSGLYFLHIEQLGVKPQTVKVVIQH